MARDHRKLKVFALADGLVLDIYRRTTDFPIEERFGLQSQLRRGAVSVPANIVEGSARLTESEYRQFLNIANGSANELAYLCDVSGRLGFLSSEAAADLSDRYNEVCRMLTALIARLRA